MTEVRLCMWVCKCECKKEERREEARESPLPSSLLPPLALPPRPFPQPRIWGTDPRLSRSAGRNKGKQKEITGGNSFSLQKHGTAQRGKVELPVFLYCKPESIRAKLKTRLNLRLNKKVREHISKQVLFALWLYFLFRSHLQYHTIRSSAEGEMQK